MPMMPRQRLSWHNAQTAFVTGW